MKRFALWSALLAVEVSAPSALLIWRVRAPLSKAPYAAVDRESHIWGRALPDSEVSTTFTITNRGSAA